MREHWARHGYGPLACVERATGRLVGEAGLQLLEAGPDVELTYTLAHDAWGQGYATEAAEAVLAWGFDGIRLEKIVAVAYPQNLASLHVIERLGMKPDGVRVCYGVQLRSFALTTADRRRRHGRQPAGEAPIIER